MFLMNCDNIKIISNNLHHGEYYGIYITGSSTNIYISKNYIYSNNNYGIYIDSDTADNNLVYSNDVWGKNQDTGILITDGDNNIMLSNYVHHNENNGIDSFEVTSAQIYNQFVIEYVKGP